MSEKVIESEILSSSADVALELFNKYLSQSKINSINFEGVGFSAASNAKNEGLPPKERLQWGTLAIQAYEQEEALVSEQDKGVTEVSQMSLRASLIISFGCIAGHKLLDLSIIESWVLDAVDKVGEENINIVTSWYEKKLDKNVLLELRKIKNRLNVCEPLVNANIIQSATIKNLLTIKENLP